MDEFELELNLDVDSVQSLVEKKREIQRQGYVKQCKPNFVSSKAKHRLCCGAPSCRHTLATVDLEAKELILPKELTLLTSRRGFRIVGPVDWQHMKDKKQIELSHGESPIAVGFLIHDRRVYENNDIRRIAQKSLPIFVVCQCRHAVHWIECLRGWGLDRRRYDRKLCMAR